MRLLVSFDHYWIYFDDYSYGSQRPDYFSFVDSKSFFWPIWLLLLLSYNPNLSPVEHKYNHKKLNKYYKFISQLRP